MLDDDDVEHRAQLPWAARIHRAALNVARVRAARPCNPRTRRSLHSALLSDTTADKPPSSWGLSDQSPFDASWRSSTPISGLPSPWSRSGMPPVYRPAAIRTRSGERPARFLEVARGRLARA